MTVALRNWLILAVLGIWSLLSLMLMLASGTAEDADVGAGTFAIALGYLAFAGLASGATIASGEVKSLQHGWLLGLAAALLPVLWVISS